MKRFFNVLKFTYIQNVKTKAFLITTLIGILVCLLSTNIDKIKGMVTSANEKSIVLVDIDNELTEDLKELIKYLPKDCKYEIRNQQEAQKLIEDLEENNDNCYDYVIMISCKNDKKIDIHTKKMSNEDIITLICQNVQNIYRNQVMQNVNVDESTTIELQTDFKMNVSEHNKTGENMQMGFVAGAILFGVVLMYGQRVSNIVIEEKGNRIMETLLTISDPKELFFGKVLGICLVCLTQVFTWGIAVVVCVKEFKGISNVLDILPYTENKGLNIFFIILYIVLGYLFYAFIFGAIGAMASSTQDANQVQMPICVFLMLQYLVMFLCLTMKFKIDIVKIVSFIPFSAPFFMPIRIGGTASLLEIIISITLLLITISLIGILSSKVYRNATLHYGKKTSILKMLKNK